MKKMEPGRRCSSWRQAALRRAIGVAVFAVIVVVTVWGICLSRSDVRALPETEDVPPRQVTFLNQLKADSRSFVAAVQYLLEAEPVPATNYNGIATNLASPELAMPTNSAATVVPTV